MYEYAATVRRVVDGDTLDADIDLGLRTWRKNERLRLVGIDTPERGAPGWAEATAGLTAMAPAGAVLRIITYKPLKTDSFGRWLADLWAGELHINAAMIERGFAVAYLP